jgi:hypothetical protein
MYLNFWFAFHCSGMYSLLYHVKINSLSAILLYAAISRNMLIGKMRDTCIPFKPVFTYTFLSFKNS